MESYKNELSSKTEKLLAYVSAQIKNNQPKAARMQPYHLVIKLKEPYFCNVKFGQSRSISISDSSKVDFAEYSPTGYYKLINESNVEDFLILKLTDLTYNEKASTINLFFEE